MRIAEEEPVGNRDSRGGRQPPVAWPPALQGQDSGIIWISGKGPWGLTREIVWERGREGWSLLCVTRPLGANGLLCMSIDDATGRLAGGWGPTVPPAAPSVTLADWLGPRGVKHRCTSLQ